VEIGELRSKTTRHTLANGRLVKKAQRIGLGLFPDAKAYPSHRRAGNGRGNVYKQLGVEFATEPTKTGPVTIAVFNDTCGNLIQLVEQ
jgi:hypothetical protein